MKKKLLLLASLVLAVGGIVPAFAKDKASVSDVLSGLVSGPEISIPEGVAPFETEAREAVLIEASTGRVLYAKDAAQLMPTSSMSKVMTMYLVFEALKTGKLQLDDTLPVSKHAWSQEGSRMFVNEGTRVKVEDLIRGVIIQSGNDASVVLAEGLGGSETGFADMLNAKAKELGLKNSHFKNATGLPDTDHYSTAEDLALLALAIYRDFPEYKKYYSEREFTYNKIKQGNRNPLLYRDIGVDGLKTGHTQVAGFGLMASGARDGRRLVLVVNGLDSMQARADESARLLEWGYREFDLYPLVRKGDVFGKTPVWLGEEATVPLVAEKDLSLSLPRTQRDNLTISLLYETPLIAPVKKGMEIGKIIVITPSQEVQEIPLVAGADVEEVGFLIKAWRKFQFMFGL